MAEKRPNIILFMADQLRFDALGCYGNNEIHTPNIDSLALNGSVFDSHFIQNPVCSPFPVFDHNRKVSQEPWGPGQWDPAERPGNLLPRGAAGKRIPHLCHRENALYDSV